jgi:hypothetical protein
MENQFDRAGWWGTSGNNPSGTGGPNDFGINKNYLGSYGTAPVMYQGDWAAPGWNREITPGYTTNTFNGPGGMFTSQGGKAWTDSFGNQIQDLGQYTQSKERQQQGSDFAKYQPQLDSTLASLLKSSNTSAANTARLDKLMTDPNAIMQTPGYQFALDQGNQAINRSAAAKGMLGSGNVLSELAKYGQGMASQEYDKQIQREIEAAKLGQSQQGTEQANVNTLASLMQNAQKFGVDSGYYNPQQYLNPLDVKRSENKSWNWSWSGKM